MIPNLHEIKSKSVEVIPGQLYFYPNKFPPKANIGGAKILNFDKTYVYRAINKDHGPLNIGQITDYCEKMEEHLQDVSDPCDRAYQHVLIHHSSIVPKTLANQALLVAAFMIICQKHSVSFVLKKFHRVDQRLMAFRDAGKSDSDFEISFTDCITAVEEAINHKWYRYSSFDVRHY